MSANNLIRVAADSRTRYEHQAYDVTFGGRPKEVAATGYGTRLAASYGANFQLSVTLDDYEVGDQILMTIPPFVHIPSYHVVEAGTGTPAGSISIFTDPDDIAGTDTVLAAAVNLAAATASPTAFDLSAFIGVEEVDQYLLLEITTAGTGRATILFNASIVQTAQK